MPKVSVIVPIYGVEKYLCQCVDSILAQTLKDIEIILVNDGSKDKCPEIIDEYAKKDSRIVAVHKKNSGYGHSLNVGIEKATSPYIGIVDADDWVDADMFETLYQKAQETGAEVVKADFFRYSGQKNKNEKANTIPDEVTENAIHPLQYRAVMGMGPSIWTAIYKKDFLTQNKIKFLETPGASYQDTGLHFKTLLAAQKAVFLKKALYHYRIDNMTSSVKDLKKVFCVCDEWEEIIRWAKERQIYDTVSGLLGALQYNTYMWNWKRLSNEVKNQFLNRFSEDFKKLDQQDLIKKEHFKRKQYTRLQQIMYHPALFSLTYKIKHLPRTLLKKLSGEKHG